MPTVLEERIHARGATRQWRPALAAQRVALVALIVAIWWIASLGVPHFVLPGPPREMRPMLERLVLPELAARAGGGAIGARFLHAFGAGESHIAELLGDLMDRRRNPLVGTTASGGIVTCRLRATFDSPQDVEAALAESGESAVAVAYVVDRTHEQYAGSLDEVAAARIVSGAVGQAGPNEEYVLNTVAHLKALGIRDHWLEEVGRLVS